MTRKDYVVIAGALAEAYSRVNQTDRAVVAYVAGCIAGALAEDNPRFDSSIFAQAVFDEQ